MDKVQSKTSKVKAHFEKNKNSYILGGVCFLTGAVAGVAVGMNMSSQTATATQRVIAFKTGDVTQNVIQQLTRRGHPGIVVRCVETGESFASVRRASELLNLNRAELTSHLKGLKDSVGGLTFETLGEASA